MFVDIDYNKRRQESKLHLAKPNKQVVSIISEKFNDKLSVKLGGINQLDFSIPYTIEENGESVQNPHIDMIKEKMLIRVTLGANKEWFVIDSIEEDSSDSNTFNVTAFSLGYELKGKRISEYTEESINATDLLMNLLESSVWSIGEVDSMFDQMYRSFDSGSDSNALDCVVTAGETYGALIVWDDERRRVSFKDAMKDGEFKGLTINYGRFLNSVKRTRTTDEMVTRLYIYGNEDLSISSVNPTGQPYIENFGYFMYPFQRDKNRKVIKSSHFMSDALCHALLDHQKDVEDSADEIKALTDKILAKNTELIPLQSDLTTLQGELETILALLDTAQAIEDEALIAKRKKERDDKQGEISFKEADVARVEGELDSLYTQLENLQNLTSIKGTFTKELLDELNLYIIESAWKDDKYIDAQELYDDGVKKFEEIRQPKVVLDVTIENLMNIIEEQYYWDKISLGDLVKVKYPQMKIEYMAKIIQIDYDLENDEISLTVANTKDLLSDTEKLVQLLYSNSSATSTIENNKYKWDKILAVESGVSQLLNSEWDATKNKIIAGVNNTVEVGNRGIIIKNPDFPDEVVIMQSGVIALSKDGGETWKTAVKPDGIVAERLIGRIIIGENLYIENNSGLYSIDNSGMSVTRTDEMSRILINTVDGLKIQKKNDDGTWTSKFTVSDTGILETDEMIAKRLRLISEKDGQETILIDADEGILYLDNFSGTVGTLDGSNVSNIGDDSFADITPSTPDKVSATGGFKTVSVTWNFSSLSYIAKYQVYCSELEGFTPSDENLVYEGSSGGFVYNGEANKTYYFRVRAVNRHGRTSNFSNEVSAKTVELLYDDLEQTIADAIEEAQQASEEALTGVEEALSKFQDAWDNAEQAQATADGKNTAFYGSDTPLNPKEGDIWFKPADGGGYIPLQYENGIWVQKNDTVALTAQETAEEAKAVGEQAKLVGEQAQAKADEVIDVVNQAVTDSQNAVTNANNAVATANQATADAQSAIAKAQEGFDKAQQADTSAQTALGTAQESFDKAQNASSTAQTALDTAQESFNKAQEALNNSSSAVTDAQDALEKAQSGFDTAQGALDVLNGVKDDLVWKLEIYASNGITFKNSIINTVLTARVYKGKNDVTDTLLNSSFRWIKTDRYGNIDTAWNNAHIGVGKSVTITEADVQSRATFTCEILVD